MSLAVNSEDWMGGIEMLTFLTGRRRGFLLAASAAFLGAISFPEGQPTPLFLQLPWVLSLVLCGALDPSPQSRINVPAAVVAAVAGSICLTLTIAGFGDPSGMTAATLTLLPLLFLCVVPDEPTVSISSGATAVAGVALLTIQGHVAGPETLLSCAIAALIAFGSARLYRHERRADLDALREAVDQQHRLEARWQTLSEASSDAILLVDVSADQVLAANRVASDWFGRKDTADWRLSPMLREDGDNLKARCEGRIPWGVQGAVITAPSGDTFAGDLRVYPVEDGERLLVAVIIKDATQRLRQLKEREKTNRLAQVGTVATGIVHEINNPLSFMMANLYYLEDALNTASGITPPPRSTLIEVIKDTRKGVRRIQKISSQMLNFSRNQEDSRSAVDVRRSLSMVVKMARDQLPQDSRIHLDVDETPPVLFNAVQFGQVLLNLLLNAAQALQRGGGGDVYVRTFSRPPNRVVVEIRDTGPGMSQEVLQRVTEPFFTTRPEGTGLGLSVCSSIVRDHDGWMTIDSIEGKGTVVRLELVRVMEASLLDQMMLNASDSSI